MKLTLIQIIILKMVQITIIIKILIQKITPLLEIRIIQIILKLKKLKKFKK